MTPAEVAQLAKSLAGVLRPLVTDAIEKRTSTLEQRLGLLEQRAQEPSVTYAGVHSPGQQYHVGQLVSKGGALWLCLQTTEAVPGGHPASWRLIVKSGGGER